MKQNQQLNLRYVINEKNHIFPVKMTFLKQILKYGVKTGKNPLPQIQMQIVRNPVRKWLDKYETIPGRKYDFKLKEILLEKVF